MSTMSTKVVKIQYCWFTQLYSKFHEYLRSSKENYSWTWIMKTSALSCTLFKALFAIFYWMSPNILAEQLAGNHSHWRNDGHDKILDTTNMNICIYLLAARYMNPLSILNLQQRYVIPNRSYDDIGLYLNDLNNATKSDVIYFQTNWIFDCLAHYTVIIVELWMKFWL